MGTKGFITLATGNENYYKIAANLLKSYLVFHSEKSKYRVEGSKRLPFAILADRENEYTALFDDVIILENPTKSYFDKISLLNNIPYDETVFIEADCIAYSDLNEYFRIFQNADDFSVLGYTKPIDKGGNWLVNSSGKYKDKITFVPSFHSAVLYMKRNGKKCYQMYQICMDVNNNYTEYFDNNKEAIDDKLLILSSAVVKCKPTNAEQNHYSVYPINVVCGNKPKVRIDLRENSYYSKILGKRVNPAIICHWGNYLTYKYLYKREVHSINCILNGKSPAFYLYSTAILYPIYKTNEYFSLIIKPNIIEKLSKNFFLKKIWHIIKK